MDSMNKQKVMTLGDEPPGWKVPNMLLVKSRGQLLPAPERMKWLAKTETIVQLWICLVVKVKPDIVKNNVAQEPGNQP